MRDQGFYYVRLKGRKHWTIAYLRKFTRPARSVWRLVGCADNFTEDEFAEIGERVPFRDEAKQMRGGGI